MIKQEIQQATNSEVTSKTASTNQSKPPTTKKTQNKPALKQSSSRSMSTSTDTDITALRLSPRDTPNRKYFDSGDYELARAGILTSSSVGSIHACPDKLASYAASRSNSSHHLDEFSSSMIFKNHSAPNTLHKSIFSMSNLEE